MMFLRDDRTAKQVMGLQIGGLVAMLCGVHWLGWTLFLVGAVMAYRAYTSGNPNSQRAEKRIMKPKRIRGARRIARELEKMAKEEALEAERAQDGHWTATIEDSVIWRARPVKTTDIPNGFVVNGPDGRPILVDFDEDGEVINKAVEVSIDGWGNVKLTPDTVVLVHSVKGDDEMLVKSLQVNHLYCNDEPIGVNSAMKMGVLPKVAKALREKYLEAAATREAQGEEVQ